MRDFSHINLYVSDRILNIFWCFFNQQVVKSVSQ